MGSGCLAPKPNQGDLAAQLIDELHAGSTTCAPQQKYLQEASAYGAEKQKTFKKAALRKLVDYLSSHRHRLTDCLALNLKACLQKGHRAAWTTGLIILERIALMGSQGGAGRSTPKIEEVLRAKGQNSSCQDSEVLKGDLKTLKTECDKQNKSGYYSLQSSPGELLATEITSARFQSVLLDTVSSCLQEPSLYKECLRVLSEYLQMRQKCLQNEEKANALLCTLMQNLRTDYEPLFTLESYFRLLSKLKDKAVLSMSSEVKTVIRMWIECKCAIGSAKSISTISSCENKLAWLELIIGRFLSSSLNGMQYGGMIRLLMELQDELLFDISLEFQTLLIYILSESDLGAHFLKALFLEFLRYGTMGSFNTHVFNQITENSRELLSSHAEVTYKNIKDRRARGNLYSLLRRWLVSKKYIALGEIISYHSTLFLYCFMQHSQDEPCRATSADILKEATVEHKIILIESAFELYQRKETSPYVRNLLFIFHKPLSDSLKEVALKSNISRFAIETNNLAFNESLQVYMALMELYSKFDKGTTLLYMQQICELLGSIVTFLHENEEDKEKLNGKLLSFIRFMITADAILLAVAFYHQVQRILQKKTLKEEQAQSLTKLSLEIREILEDNKIPNLTEDLTCYEDSNQSHSTIENNRLGEFSCYFKELVSTESRSKFIPNGEFEKPVSVLRQPPQKEEQSMQDILQMINY